MSNMSANPSSTRYRHPCVPDPETRPWDKHDEIVTVTVLIHNDGTRQRLQSTTDLLSSVPDMCDPDARMATFTLLRGGQSD